MARDVSRFQQLDIVPVARDTVVETMDDGVRIESGRLPFEIDTVDLDQVVVEAIGGMKTQIDERDHMLTVDVLDDLPRVQRGYDRLVQVLSHLVSNVHGKTPGCPAACCGASSLVHAVRRRNHCCR